MLGVKPNDHGERVSVFAFMTSEHNMESAMDIDHYRIIGEAICLKPYVEQYPDIPISAKHRLWRNPNETR